MSNKVLKVVVLGANSFSGQDFVDLLLDDPQREVIGVSRSPERCAMALRYKVRDVLSRYQYPQMDMNHDMPALLDLLDAERPPYIVNFAAQSEVGPSWHHPEHWFETNTVSLAKLVNHLRQQDYVERYLHISSPEVYGTTVGTVREDHRMNPSTPYAASKAAADFLLATYQQQYGFPLLSVRATNVYGARQQRFKIIPRSVIYIKNGTTIELHGGGVAVKSYIHIRDVSHGELAILERGEIGAMYHLSPDEGIAVRDIVQIIAERMNVRFENVTRMVDERPGQDAAYVIDSSCARDELGWSPQIRLEDGLSDVVEWVEAYWDEINAEPLTYQHKP